MPVDFGVLKAWHDETVRGGVFYCRNKPYNVRALSDAEWALFQAEFDILCGPEGSVMRRILEKRCRQILGSLMFFTKKKGTPFTGFSADGGEIGWSILRPEHMDAVIWGVAQTSTGWANQYNSSSSKGTMNDESMVLLLGLLNPDANVLSEEWRITVGKTDYAPVRLDSLILGDTGEADAPIVEIPSTIIVEKETWYSRVYIATTGTDGLGFLGVCIGTGSYLNAETIS